MLRLERGRSKGFRQNIRVLLIRSYKPNVSLPRTNSLSHKRDVHVNVHASTKAESVVS